VTGGRDSILSPPSVASLLDISLPGPPEEALAPGEPQMHISDSIIELAINSAHYGASQILSHMLTTRKPDVWDVYFFKTEKLQLCISIKLRIY